MSDVEWDSEDYVPPAQTTARATDKWEGEDEEEEVKESWEDDDKKDNLGNASLTTTTAKAKKKKLADILAEKEKRQIEEKERRHREKEEEKMKSTPEQILAEKLRIQKIQEDSDFSIAAELLAEKPESTSLDAFDLCSSDSLAGFRMALLKKIRSLDRLEKRPFYLIFVEDLCRDLCENLDVEDVKKVTAILNALYNEKMKANRPKSKKKASGKAKLNVGPNSLADEAESINTYNNYDEYDDFI